jgi:5-carboxymethyl-2-hydroxymuconate isomerase
MPHLTLEYTENLAAQAPGPDLFARLHGLLESAAGIRKENCKSRWRPVQAWLVGGGSEKAAYVHLSIQFLEGRSEKAKVEVGQGALALLQAHFAPAEAEMDLQITVEVREIQRTAYFKHPPGTLSPPAATMV